MVLRTLGSRLRRLLELENRPPMSNSASNENARRCLVHFFPAFGGLFSEIVPSAARLLLLLLAQKKNNRMAAMTATTTGTATAAWSEEEQDILLHDDFSETVTAPVVLLAALLAVLDGVPLVGLPESTAPVDAEVANVVGEDAVASPAAEAPEPEVSVAVPDEVRVNRSVPVPVV